MENSNIPQARRRLARIRCLQECVKALLERKAFPDAICYIPLEIEYKTNAKTTWKLLEAPKKSATIVKEITATPSSRLVAAGEEVFNSFGRWLRVLRVKISSNETFEVSPESPLWLLLYSNKNSLDETPAAVPVDESSGNGKAAHTITDKKGIYKIKSWEGYIEETYSPLLKKQRAKIVSCDEEAMKRMQTIEKDWTLEHDVALTNLLFEVVPGQTETVGSLKNNVDDVEASSFSTDEGEINHLTDDDPATYWQSDGSEGQHWIKLRMKRGTIIKSLVLVLDMEDSSFLPQRILVYAGHDDLNIINTIDLDWSDNITTEIKVLEDLKEHFPVIKITIKECKNGGIDTRIRGIKLSCLEKATGFSVELFSGNVLLRHPILQPFSADVLHRRATILQRFRKLLDSVIKYLVPSWQCTIDTSKSGEGSIVSNLLSIRQILPLSSKRMSLIDTLLRHSSSECLEDPMIVYINRHAAAEERAKPTGDFKNTVFMQLHKGLQPKDRSAALDYRWPSHTTQWWECKFISEKVIDQGGGFRDSLSDIAEELCPSEPGAHLSLPYFIRAPNQENEDGNINKDVYVPNPACVDFARFEWIGQIMGACVRSKELLILSLAPYIWRLFNGEPCTWSKDFITVDAAEVRLIDNLCSMDQETFDAACRNWSLALSDGTNVSLKVDDDGNPKPLKFEEREEYAEKVREIRMGEFDKQIKAIKTGLLKVLPESVLYLLTWQELEIRVCGEPEITLEALKNSTICDIDDEDARTKHFWSAVSNFTVEERSRLLRFITGRRRLPVKIYLSSDEGSSIDGLPTSSTCSNTLHWPFYSNEKLAEEKLRYAVYHCVSIDTDG